MTSNPIKVAILDMNNGHPNLGLQSIVAVVAQMEQSFAFEVFDVRSKGEVPSLDFDIFISSGGPGSPFEGDGDWDKRFYELIDQIWDWNQNPNRERKKHVLFICHSFQMACLHFGVATIKRRKSISFGIFPTQKTERGQEEKLFKALPDPFYIADFRSWQAVQPNEKRLAELGAKVLCIEKERPHVKLERAIMAIRFSPEILAVQFHPEAHAEGMLKHFSDKKRKVQVIRNHGKDKYEQMIADMKDPDKIALTNQTVIPGFLDYAFRQILSLA